MKECSAVLSLCLWHQSYQFVPRTFPIYILLRLCDLLSYSFRYCNESQVFPSIFTQVPRMIQNPKEKKIHFQSLMRVDCVKMLHFQSQITSSGLPNKEGLVQSKPLKTCGHLCLMTKFLLFKLSDVSPTHDNQRHRVVGISSVPGIVFSVLHKHSFP